MTTLNNTKIKKFDLTNIGKNPFLFYVFFLLVFSFGIAIVESTFNNAQQIDSTVDNITTSKNFLGFIGTPLELGHNTQIITSNASDEVWVGYDGAGDYIETPSNPANNVTSFDTIAISVWANPQRNDTNMAIFSQDQTSGNAGILFRITATNLDFFPNTDDGHSDSQSIDYLSNQWMHLVVIHNFVQNITTFYKDGAEISDENDTAQVDAVVNNGYYIGSWKGSSNFFNGSIDELRVYNGSLTENQVLEINASGRIPNSSLYSNTLIFWTSFNENIGSTTYDKAPFGNNGTLRGNSEFQTNNQTISLVDETDYTLSNNVFTLDNDRYEWSAINITYVYESITSSSRASTNVLRLTGVFIAILFIALLLIPILKFTNERIR